MKAGAIITTLVGSILFGCSDSHSVEESVPNSGEEIQSANESAPTPKVDATEILEKELCDQGIETGWNQQQETLTVIASEQFNPKQRRMTKDDFVEKYDFELPDNAGECSQLAYAFWKAYASALAEIAKTEKEYLSIEDQRKLTSNDGDNGEGADPSESTLKTCLTAKQKLSGVKILRHVWAVDDANTYSCALAVQMDVAFYKRVLKGGPFRPGRFTLKQRIDEIPADSTIGPDVYVDNEGTLWHLGVVPVDKEPTGMTPDWSMRLAYEFALRTVSAQIDCRQSVESIRSEYGEGLYTLKQRYISEIRMSPMLRVEKNDSTRIRRFTLKAKHPILGEIQYKVCAIRD